ncbi:MAG: helix-turn-helix domain-containing protein [Actinomycetota bacterium]
MSYREMAPSTDVSHLVFSFWEFSTATEDFGSIQHEIFPDGCISVFYHRNDNFNLKQIAFNGLNLESVTTPIFPNDIFWGMRISPAACANILRDNLANFKLVEIVEAGRFPHLTDGLLEKLNDCENLDEAVIVYEKHLKELNFNQNFYDEKVAQAVKIIEQTSGEIKVAELAEELNLSVRQLERRFKTCSGLSPKQFARTRRIRATAVDLVKNNDMNWANRAAEMGFADQSHLTHEFVSVTKRSPNSFAEKVSQIKHGNLVK